MWLRNPQNPTLVDDITDPNKIPHYLAAGWTQAGPVWMLRGDGQIFYVTHPEHQVRMLQSGFRIVDAPATEVAPAADDASDDAATPKTTGKK